MDILDTEYMIKIKNIHYITQNIILKKLKKYNWTRYFKTNSFPHVWDYSFLKHHNSVVLSSVIVEKNLIQQLGGFRAYTEPLILNTLLTMIVG